MRRLVAAYRALEDTAQRTLDRAHASVQGVEALIEQQASSAQTATMLGREALARDDHHEWLLHESQRDLASWNRTTLNEVLHRREQLAQIARERYHDSFLQRRKIEVLVETLRIDTEILNRRRDQATLDDRYLSRAQWLKKQQAKRMNSS
jgi:hypothetical protein